MHKVLEFLKKIPGAYYKWKRRNEKLSTFLEQSQENFKQIDRIDHNVATLQNDLNNVKGQVSNLEQQINRVNINLESISAGTKMELFDTIHHWRTILVVNKQWASPAEKREVEELFRIYHDSLKGNGQGERYYNEIMALPESEEEKNNRG